MAKVLDMPKLSPTMEEGQISAWHKKVGDAVQVDELLADVETDKATMEYRSFDQGTLLKILAPAGSVVKLGAPVAILGKPGEDVSAFGGGDPAIATAGSQIPKGDPAIATAGSQIPKGDPAIATAGSQIPKGDPAIATAGSQIPKGDPAIATAGSQIPKGEVPFSERVKASPYVRKRARELDLDLRGVAGSGPGGRIIARDLDGATAGAKNGVTAHPAARGPNELAAPEVRPLSMMRKAIARRLTESKQTVPHFYLTIDVDVDALVTLREQMNLDLARAGEGGGAIKISMNDLLVKACAIALARVPECNAQFTADAILIHQRIDISVAVAVAEGLVTPVLRDADRKSVLEIAAEVRELAGRAKAKKLKAEEMANGTFSISNLGMYGIDAFSAVINPPEGAILAVGQVRREPVVKGDAIVPGHRLTLTLSCDHRVVDGAVGATFLKALRDLLEKPMQILLM